MTPMEGGAPVQLVTGSHAGRPSWSAEGLVVFNSDIGMKWSRPMGRTGVHSSLVTSIGRQRGPDSPTPHLVEALR